jgi:hypothetical protein
MDGSTAAKLPAAFGTFGLHQVPPTSAQPQHLALGGYFEPLGCRFLRLNTFWSSHKMIRFSSKKSAQYRILTDHKARGILANFCFRPGCSGLVSGRYLLRTLTCGKSGRGLPHSKTLRDHQGE